MTDGRVLLVDYQSPWTRGPPHSFCQGGALAVDECYFEPISSCSLRDAYGPDVVAAWGQYLSDATLDAARQRLHGDRVTFNAVTGQDQQQKPQLPSQAAPFLGGILKGVLTGGIPSEMFWFRAIATAYVVRLNSRTLQVINHLKQLFFQGQSVAPGTLSVHIRRGDKAGKEMQWVSDETFQALAWAMYDANKDVLNRTAFVSTEDPGALHTFTDNMKNWTVQYTTVPRNNHQGKQPFAHAPTVEAVRAFLNLDLLLECNGWVGTMGSAWSTLTERLRSTVRCKADMPYADGFGKVDGG
ncbi:hypothetical protein OEZ86_010133 [Tetradesmus obliquus]|nr:hypothetical protein OEZ86_010133 [Tetradesmus obliquus]